MIFSQGNALYKDGKYELSVECYSRAMLLDPISAVLPANRAMALLKLERYVCWLGWDWGRICMTKKVGTGLNFGARISMAVVYNMPF